MNKKFYLLGILCGFLHYFTQFFPPATFSFGNTYIDLVFTNVMMILFSTLTCASFTGENIYKKIVYTFISYIGIYLFSTHVIGVIYILVTK